MTCLFEGGWVGKNFSQFSIVSVYATAAGEREKSQSYSCWKKEGTVESPPHEALSWSLQFSPALPERKDDLSQSFSYITRSIAGLNFYANQ
jgi:hypothetical protein